MKGPSSEKIQKQAENDQFQANLLQADEEIAKINNLNPNTMQQISQASKIRMSKRESLDSVKSDSIDFADQLNLDMLIQRLLQALTRTKIQLMELNDGQLIKETPQNKKFKQYFTLQLKKYNNALLLRESQLGALVYVIQRHNDEDFNEKYWSTYGELQNFIIRPENAQKPINTVILQEAFQTEIQFLKQYTDTIVLMKLNLVHKKYLSDLESLIKISNRLKIINSKIATIAQIFPYACIMDKDDLFSYKRTSKRWHKLTDSGVITYKNYGDQQTVMNSFLNLKSGLNIVNATMSIWYRTRQGMTETQNWTQDIGNLAESTSKILKCLIWKQDASFQAQVLFSDPNKDLAKQIWNLPEQKMLRNIINTIMPSIAYSQQFYIPRLFEEYIAKKGEGNLPDLCIENIKQYTKTLFQPKQYKQRLPMRINSPFLLSKKAQKQKQKQASTSKLTSSNLFSSLLNSIQGSKQTAAPTSVILHIHGGGFISMSSYIHQTYTRIWANNLKTPIISVDYGKAPQNPFPHGLHDCFQAYMWTLYCYRQVYEAEPIKIILVGDSAGGNLVAALTTMLIRFGMRVPDGIVLVYPALNLNYNNYTPSLLTALNDMILPHTFLKICLRAYLSENLDPFNPQISPLYSKEEVLKKYPPTRIFVGNKDPFHDDCCRFAQKLNKIQQKVKLMIFDEFPHGFLQFDVKTQPHQISRKATKQVQNALAQLLSL